MTTAGPWSVKGIDPKAREIAKDLARRSGLTLGEWLNQMIVDTSEGDAGPPVESRPDPWAEPPVPLARGPEGAGGFGAESFRARLQNVGRAAEAAELSRVTRALNDLATRMEAAEHRSTLAISGIDQQVMGVLSRIEDGERDAASTAARFDGALDEVRAAQDTIAARLARTDAEDAPRVEAMKSLESALARMAAQIYEAEGRARAQTSELREDLSGLSRRVEQAEAAAAEAARAADARAFEAALAKITDRLDTAEAKTSAAVAALETSFASLDSRVGNARGEDLDARFAQLATELQARVEGDRAGMADRLREAAADPKLDRMERALRTLSAQVGDAEKRSAEAIDRMGHEIMRIAQNMHGRMERAEVAGAEAVERMGGEMAKLADVMENRSRRADDLQAQALERLGGEIGRIAETLSERIGSSERRTAKAVSDLGDQLEGATARLDARYGQAAAELAGRQGHPETDLHAPPEPRAVEPSPSPAWSYAQPEASDFVSAEDAAESDPAVDPFAHIGSAPEPARAAAPEPFAAHDPFAALEADLAARAAAAAPARDPFPQAPEPPSDPFAFDAFAPPPSAAAFAREPAASDPLLVAPADEALFAPAAPLPLETQAAESDAPFAPRRTSTQDLIASARAAAREAAEAKSRRGKASEPAAAPATLAAPALQPLPREGKRGPFSLSLPTRRKRESGTLRTLAYASGVAVTITMAAVGAANIASHAGEGQEGADAPTAARVQTANGAAPAAAQAGGSTLAMAVSPAEGASGEGSAPAPAIDAPATPSAALAATPPAASPNGLEEARLIYSTAVRRLEGGDAAGLPDLRRAANLGLPQAQFHLASLYEEGKSGLPKDAAQARAWMARAASGGESRAMFNLGLFYANGDGGVQDDRSAVAWFRRAADLGLHDAQFNLAVMNQNGRGAPKSVAEAYKWFLIAAANGDAGAKSSADALKAQLAPDALAAAERSAAAYRAQNAGRAVVAAAG